MSDLIFLIIDAVRGKIYGLMYYFFMTKNDNAGLLNQLVIV